MSKAKGNKTFTSNRNEIIWNIINSGLAGGLVFLGACTAGNLTWTSITLALLASATIAVSRFKDYWAGEEKEYKNKCKNLKVSLGTFF